MTSPDDDTDVVKEIQGLQVPRVDAVGSPAHGLAFLVLKAADVDPLAELDRVLKAKYSAQQLRQMGKDGRAFRSPDGTFSYPIGDRADVENAVRAVGRGRADHDAIRRFIQRRAKQLKATDLIPDNWASDGSLSESVEKAMDPAEMAEQVEALEDGTAAVDETAAGTLDVTHEGDPDEPCTPAWEAYDAAMARAVTAKLVWTRDAIGGMRDRESAEVAAGETGDATAAVALDEVLAAIDFAVGVVGKHAIDEQAEADGMADDIEAAAEALGIVKAADTLTAAVEVEVRKAGRVLSAANEAALRSAHAALTEVLGRLPQPTQEEETVPAPDEDGAVTKAATDNEQDATADTETVEKATGPTADEAPVEPVEKATESSTDTEPAQEADAVVKAGGMDVDTLRGMLLKLVRALPDSQVQEAFQSMAGAVSPTGPEEDGDEAPEPASEAAPELPDVPADVEPVEDAAPAMPEGEDEDAAVVKTATPADGQWTFEQLTGALKAAVTPLEERIVKERADADTRFGDQLAAALAPLVERIEKMEAQPVPGPMLNGQVPGGPPLALRGQGSGGGMDEVLKAIHDADERGPHQGAVARAAAAHALMVQKLNGQ